MRQRSHSGEAASVARTALEEGKPFFKGLAASLPYFEPFGSVTADVGECQRRIGFADCQPSSKAGPSLKGCLDKKARDSRRPGLAAAAAYRRCSATSGGFEAVASVGCLAALTIDRKSDRKL